MEPVEIENEQELTDMDSGDFHLHIDYFGTCGVVLNPEEKAALQTSLAILKNEQRFHSVKLWGKLLGVKDNYYIAQGSGDDELARKTFYSRDCIRWHLMTPVSREAREKARLVRGRFIGDPAHDIEYQEWKPETESDVEIESPNSTKIMKEEERLAAVIADIDEDCRITPRGALVLTPKGQVVQNRNFEGLTVSETAKLLNFYHLREQVSENRSGLDRADFDQSIDFLDPVEDDIPRGCWSVQYDRGSAQVLLRSLYWLGYFFFHVPGTDKYGSFYYGIGEKNRDLPFMLP